MKPEIKEKNKFFVIGLQIKTTLETCSTKIRPMWEKFITMWDQIKNVKNSEESYGVCFNDVMDEKHEDCSKDVFVSMAAREVTSVESIPQGMVAREIPKCKYAVFVHEGSCTTMHQTYTDIYSKWLAENKLKPLMSHPSFEFYDKRFTDKDGSVCEIWIPIE
jgi:AraC family transcriptional regulator